MSRFSKLSALTAAVMILVSNQAFAHAHLKGSVPADKATVASSPKKLDLTFSEELNLKFSGVELVGPANADIKLGNASLLQGKKVLTVPLPEELKPGTYTVKWHALSEDGHKTTGAYSFTFKP